MTENIEILKNIIDTESIKKIDNSYRKEKVDYFSLKLDKNKKGEDTFYYITKDGVILNKEYFSNIINGLSIINNELFKKLIVHIMENDKKVLSKMLFSKKVIEVLEYQYNKIKKENPDFTYKDLPLTYFGRFDLIIDQKGNPKIVEINSETPAGMPESFGIEDKVTPFVKEKDKYIDINNGIEKRLYDSLEEKIKTIRKKENQKILVLYSDETDISEFRNFSEYSDSSNPEDYVNSLHLTDFLDRQLENSEVNIARVDYIEIKEDGIYYKGIKQDYIWSFYPLEWFFTDKGGNTFWNAYMNGEFELLNNPLNLITQNKAVWAYIWELVNIDSEILTKEEKDIIKEFVPEYFFERPKKIKTILKPLLYREGVGIGDDSFIGDAVYQSFVEQKKYNVNCFYDGETEGFLTLGFYFGEKGYIGTYNRFCDHFITDELAQTIPLYIEK